MRVADSGSDGDSVEALVEISCSALAAQLHQRSPQIDLVASGLAAKALVDITPHVDRECQLAIVVRGVVGEGARPSPLVAVYRDGCEVNSVQDPANRYFSAQQEVVNRLGCGRPSKRWRRRRRQKGGCDSAASIYSSALWQAYSNCGSCDLWKLLV
jgi:hypothetical protein